MDLILCEGTLKQCTFIWCTLVKLRNIQVLSSSTNALSSTAPSFGLALLNQRPSTFCLHNSSSMCKLLWYPLVGLKPFSISQSTTPRRSFNEILLTVAGQAIKNSVFHFPFLNFDYIEHGFHAM